MRWWLVLLLLAPVAGAQPLLVGVVPDLPGSGDGEDAVAVQSAIALDLAGYTLDDGEGRYTFPSGTTLQPGVPLWMVANATLWADFDGPAPGRGDFSLKLGNDGDDLRLLDPTGAVVDSFAYGDKGDPGYTSPGLVYTRRDDGWVTPRMHRVGESSLDRPSFDVDRLTLYASPDSSFDVLTGLIAGATERLHLHVYELRSAALADALVAAKARTPGLDLQVLVEDRPVGQDAQDRHETADALRRIEAAGGTAWLAGSQRYDHHHLKVLVADDAVAVQSENWVPSGVPQDPSWGNRGWGAVVHDAAAADWFTSWMAADRAAWDTAPFELADYDPAFLEPARLAPRTGDHRPVAARELTGSFRVTPVVAPDHTQDPATDPIAAVAASARRRLDVQQLDLSLSAANRLGWSSADPLTSAIASAQAAGAKARVQAAQPFAADDTGNRAALDWLADRGVAGHELERSWLGTLHNKGLVADDVVVLGSINGNHHSRSENREVALVLEGPGVAEYYADLFEADWGKEPSGRDWGAPLEDLRALPLTPLPTLLAVLGVALVLRGRP